MKPYFGVIAAAALSVLAGCSSPSLSSGGPVMVVDGFEVKWSEVPALQPRVREWLTPLVFSFNSLNPAASNGVTEADWQRQADKSGMAVSDLKSFYHSAYKGPDGSLRVCTISAIQKGLCAGSPTMSLNARVNAAKAALAQSDKCAWVGFDRGYHGSAAYNLGAEEYTLHVQAKCG